MKTKLLSITIFLCLFLQLNAQDALTANITNPTYNKDCKNGEIDLMINAGFPPYDVVWKRITFNGTQVVQTTTNVQGNNDGEDIQNVFAATYLVEVTDALCGVATETFKIKCACSYDCTIEGSVTHPSCEQEGAISINMNCLETGHTPFTYKWSDGNNFKDRTNLSPGIYCLTVSDKNACTFQDCFTVEMGSDLQIALADKQNVNSCDLGPNGSACNGSIDIEIINGNGGYQYKWSNGANTQDLSSLCQGFYYLTVTDNLNCKKTLKVEICCCSSSNASGLEDCYGNQSNPAPLNIQGEAQGLPNPNIIVNVSGGTGDYSCSWTGPNGYTAYSCIGIGNMTEVGTYCITADDGCDEVTKCFDIVDCSQTNIAVSGNILHTCDELTVGSVSLIINGGTPPYEVSWNNSQYTGSTIQNLDEGQYCAYVRDVNGCIEGPFCFNVGSQPGEVTTSTVPCARTIICNGIAYSDVFEYEVSWDCNRRSSYCPASDETVIDEFGWANLYVEFCNLWGVCQSGETILLDIGEPVFKPLLKGDESCEYGEACVNSYCKFDGQIVYDDAVPSYCPLISNYHQHFGQCGEECRARMYCNGTFMKYICTDIPCIFASNDNSNELVTKFDEIKSFNNAITTSQFIAMVESGKLNLGNDLINTKENNHNLTSSLIHVYPNPTQGVLNIEFSSNKKGIINYSVVNLLGEKTGTYSNNITTGFNTFELDISNYTPGVYFIRVMTPNNTTKTFKIIKN